jgi:glucokinase
VTRRAPGPSHDRDVVVAVDLGGTQVRTAVFDLGARMLTRTSAPTPRGGPGDVVAAVIAQVRQAADRVGRPVAAVGVSALGPVDPDTGTIRSAPTLTDFHDVSLAAPLRDALQVPVHVVNDADAAALAEWRLGAGRGMTDFCYVTVSTGIGCGIVANGGLVTGHAGGAGELGRLRLPAPDGGSRRLEDVSSGTAIAAAARRALADGMSTSLGEHGDPSTLTARQVAAAARSGDRVAREIFTTACDVLGVQLANLVRLVSPEVIVVGGGVTGAGAVFWAPLRAALSVSLAHDAITPPDIVRAELQGDAGLHGAVLAVLDHA